MKRFVIVLAGVIPLALATPLISTLEAQDAPKSELYDKTIKPLLAENCLTCHGETARGGLPRTSW